MQYKRSVKDVMADWLAGQFHAVALLILTGWAQTWKTQGTWKIVKISEKTQGNFNICKKNLETQEKWKMIDIMIANKNAFNWIFLSSVAEGKTL